jgi:dihydrodipicolinate reductase
MKISLIGYGRMGREVKSVANEFNIKVVSIIDPSDSEATHRKIDEEALKDADVAIDFTRPDAVVNNVKLVAKNKVNMVVGTTGWYDKLNIVSEIVKENNIGLVYGSNFSIGANVFFKIVNYASSLLGKIEDFDPYVFEMHHRMKVDSPSGTAKEIAKIVLNNFPNKKKLQYEKLDRKIEPEELHVVSLRAGFRAGFHLVGFDSEYETIELTHNAKSRKGFAKGAILAAKWIMERKGIYNFNDVFDEIIAKSNF